MQLRSANFLAALATAVALSTPASAAIVASATTALNVHSGPGPQFTVIGAIPTRGQATVIGCTQSGLWCSVSHKGRQGWVYSRYLVAALSGRSLAAASVRRAPRIVYQPPAEVVSTVPAPAQTAAVIAPPPSRPLIFSPPDSVASYVIKHPIEPVYVDEEMVPGAELPGTVTLARVPGADYDYAYVNSAPVLVEPSTRQVLYVYH